MSRASDIIPSTIFDRNLIPYITTNEPIPSALIPAKDAVVEYLSSTHSQIERKISDLQKTVQDLMIRRELVEKERTTFASLSAPIRHVPSELIAKILTFSLYNSCDLMDFDERIRFAGLRSVSRLWRTTAFGTPSLWRGLSVNLAGYFNAIPDGYDHPLDRLIVRWFKRAGDQAPVRLLVHGQASQITAQMVALFVVESKCAWRQLVLLSSEVCASLGSLRNSNWALPTLMEFTYINGTLLVDEAKFPQVQSLCVVGNRNHLEISITPPLQVSNALRTLHLANIVGEGFAMTLSSMPKLEELILSGVRQQVTTPGIVNIWQPASNLPPAKEITHTHIKTLVLIGQDVTVIDGLKLPSLILLRVIGHLTARFDYQTASVWSRLSHMPFQTLSLENCETRDIPELLAGDLSTTVTRLHVHNLEFIGKNQWQFNNTRPIFPASVRKIVSQQPVMEWAYGDWIRCMLNYYGSRQERQELDIYHLPPPLNIQTAVEEPQFHLRSIGIRMHYSSPESIQEMLKYDILGHQYHIDRKST
ncbi:hypothetical protein FA15DRAFT_669900 [Coprinopsis marcescibilis]|uniref:F-box domain-containing protein n=1 Tax=Coprinopsis marcescibilis TaxID=230819 RepID=A0A5C3KUE8_COPMA|nr:hypothetical protein FA15DRAFT_669900 [Coprinopsis marcescibilis]